MNLSRRRFLVNFPQVVVGYLTEWPDNSPDSGADSAENLTWRVTALEISMREGLAIVKEMGDEMDWMLDQLLNPGEPPYHRPRKI